MEDFSALAEPVVATPAIVFDEADHFDTIEHMGSALETLRKHSVPGIPARLISERERVRRARLRA